MKNRKVFAIGFNKSGTMSLHALFQSMGLQSYHGVKWREANDLALLNAYDCFSDGGPIDIARLDTLFPGARYILQLRDLDSWICSRLAHIDREKAVNPNYGGLEWDNTEYAVKVWIKKRNVYHQFVLSYFADRAADILVVNYVRDELAAEKISSFLGYEGEYQKPRINCNPYKVPSSRHAKILENCIAELDIPERELKFDVLCPSLMGDDERSRFPADSSMFE